MIYNRQQEALYQELCDVIPEAKAVEVLEFITGDIDPMECEQVLERAQNGLFAEPGWQQTMRAIACLLGSELVSRINLLEGGVTLTCHLRYDTVLSYSSARDEFSVEAKVYR